MDFRAAGMANLMSLLSLRRFHPNDHQLISHFLSPKAMGLSLPYNRIQTAAIDKWTNPEELADKVPLGRDLERYFFARTGILVADDHRDDAVGGRGYWKPPSENAEEIVFNDDKIGEKRELIYFAADGSETQWVMYEYRAFLTDEPLSPSAEPDNVEKWVVYKLINKGDVDVYDTEEAAAGGRQRNSNIAPERVLDEYDDVLRTAAAEAAAATALFFSNKLDSKEEDKPPASLTDPLEDLPDTKRRKGNTSGVVVADNSDCDDENKKN
ncbi:NAC transcription factor 25-like [Carica papaya]|uniref:NAC transcription factor 25-like n=1 Tax=Carica papaya TaxID=3649 RepID=UPI000B8CFA99|nr:NAC transcription factor 25-like [Carica papaya]